MATSAKKTGAKKAPSAPIPKSAPAPTESKTEVAAKPPGKPPRWTKASKTKLSKMFAAATREELLKAFPERNWAAIEKQANRLGLARPHPNYAKNQPTPPKPEKTLRDGMIEFLSRARTEKELVSKFGAECAKELAALVKNPPDGYRIREGRNTFQEKTTYLERVLGTKDVKVKKSIFRTLHSENDRDYLAIIFPQNLDFSDDPSESALRIFPIDSCFWGDHLSDRETLVKFLQYLESKPYAFAFLLGDIIGGTDYTKETAVEIREDLKRHLAPVAHKILWAQSGPLEARMRRVDGVDPLQAVCQELGIHHTERPVRMDVYWKFPTKPIEFYCLHGRSAARKDGSKITAVLDPTVHNNFPHFTVMGNLKAGKVVDRTARRLDPIGFTINEHSAFMVVCAGFQKYEGSSEEKRGYPSPATGTVVCIIGADNSHKASS